MKNLMKLMISILMVVTLVKANQFHVPHTKAELRMAKFVPLNRRHMARTYHPLKIHVDYSGISDYKRDQPEKYTYLTETVMPAVISHVAATFQVHEEQSNSFSSALDTCNGLSIPEEFRQPVQADLILLTTIEDSWYAEDGAYTGACALRPKTLRPIGGVISFLTWKLAKENTGFELDFAMLLKEVYHVLGFDRSMLRYFRDQEGKLMDLKDVLIDSGAAPFRLRIKTQRVVEFAREYFNMPDLDGMPVENISGSFNIGPFWEKSLVGNEIMTSQKGSTIDSVVSELTLRFFQDTNWYKVNMSMAEDLHFGRLRSDLFESREATNQEYLDAVCTEGNYQTTVCGEDYKTFTFCGKQEGHDYKYSYVDESYDCRRHKGLKAPPHQYFGLQGRCFKGNTFGAQQDRAVCMRAMCDGNNLIYVMVGEEILTCTKAGEKLTIPGTAGYVICPEIENFCLAYNTGCKNDCSLNGRCVSGGKCFCYPGTSGDDCSIKEDGTKDDILTKAKNFEFKVEPKKESSGASCSYNCSGRGSCIDGECHCYEQWSGYDCSYPNSPWGKHRRGRGHSFGFF